MVVLHDDIVDVSDYYRTRIGKMFEFRGPHYMGPGVPEHIFIREDARFILCGVHTPIDPDYLEVEKDCLTNWSDVIRSETAGKHWYGWSQVIFEVLLGSRICYYCFGYESREYSHLHGGERYLRLFEEIS